MDDTSNDRADSNRPVVSRRSCDQCRARKVGCDRLTPCSNCVNARLACTHSAVKPRGENRQRILISPQYERKIDDIAQNVDGIRQLLEGLEMTNNPGRPTTNSHGNRSALTTSDRSIEGAAESLEENKSYLFHSKLVNQFVNDLLGCNYVRSSHPHAHTVLSALRDVLSPEAEQQTCSSADDMLDCIDPVSQNTKTMPPQAEAITVLRWATENRHFYIVVWLSQMLSLETFTEICQKVYFAVAAYKQTDFILANACLIWLFSEYAVLTGKNIYLEYSTLCRRNLEQSLARLPLILPATMEVISCLTLGAYNAIDTVRPTLAQTLCSAAIHLCQAQSFHRASSMEGDSEYHRMAKIRLFWSVYRLDKTLSLRLGHTPGLSEHDTPLPANPTVLRWVKLAVLQEKTFDQLLRTAALQLPSAERASNAACLASELQELIDETYQAEMSTVNETHQADPLRSVYLRAERVVQLSLLSIISRLSPIAERPFENISYDSLDVSRKALDAHGQSLDELCTLTHENEVVNRLFNNTILAAPFIPYLIVFCGVVGDCSQQDLARLEKFNVCLSLSSYSASPCPSKRPKRFFGLLYEMARLYYESNATDRGHDGIASAEMSDFIDVAALEAAGWQLSPQELLSDGSKAVEVPLEVSRTDADGEDGRKHPQWPLG